MNKTLKSIFLIGLVLTNLAFSVEYEPLSDQDFKGCYSNFVEIEGHPLFFNYCTNGDLSEEFIKREVEGMSTEVFSFIDSLGLKKKEHRTNITLEIFEVTKEQINDPKRFYIWHDQNPNAKELCGLYDPISVDSSKSSIMITNYGEKYNKIIIGHELSHYWFDRFGLKANWSEDLESFAVDFESYLKMREVK